MNAAVLIGRIAASASAAAAMFNSTSTDSDDADVGRLQGMSQSKKMLKCKSIFWPFRSKAVMYSYGILESCTQLHLQSEDKAKKRV